MFLYFLFTGRCLQVTGNTEYLLTYGSHLQALRYLSFHGASPMVRYWVWPLQVLQGLFSGVQSQSSRHGGIDEY